MTLKLRSATMWLHLISFTAAAALSTAVLTGCGTNLFKTQEKKDVAEDAAIELENGNPDKAITMLENALQDDPGNITYLSLLAMAYGQRAGVDPFSFIENMASDSDSEESESGDDAGDSSGSSSGNGMTAMFGIMPPATAETIADVDYALELLAQIPVESISDADKIKLALFQTAAMVLRVKILDANGNGVIDPEEILTMSSESALTVLTQMAAAATIFSGGVGAGDSGDAAGKKVTDIQAAIDAQEGATQEEKLKAYIISTQ